MQTFFILLVIVFSFCISIGLMIYDKDDVIENKDDVSKLFDEDENIKGEVEKDIEDDIEII